MTVPVSSPNALFLSDVHLRDSGSVKTRLVIRFLQEVASRFQNIFILGDLFDVWPGTNAYLVRRFRPVLHALKDLVKDGHSVHYVEGNHDFRLGAFFSNELGIEVHPETYECEWSGKKIFMAHGDLGNPRDWSYRALRYTLRLNPLHAALKFVPQSLLYEVGMRTSQLSRNYSRHSEKINAQIRQTYRETAERVFQQGYDVVLMGHTHLPDDVTTRVGDRVCRYINTGDFVYHFTYLEFDGSQFYTRTHPVKDL